jgi:hypothetical protein
MPTYEFDPVTGEFKKVAAKLKSADEVLTQTAPVMQQQQTEGSSGSTGVTKNQADVFDFMNTPAGSSYKEAFGAANSKAIGSVMPGSVVVGALKGEFTNPFSALRDAHNVFTSAEKAMQNHNGGYRFTGNNDMDIRSPGPEYTHRDDDSMDFGPQANDTRGGYDYSGSTGGGLGGVGGEGTRGSNGPGDGTAADYAYGGLASLAGGGQSHLGDYSDGGRLLRGPGDGVSDSIPATIGNKRPARLADGEFVVPARIVSELGNGSTEAGARKLYAMMDRIQKGRKKSIGQGRVAVNSKAEKMLPA